MNDLFQEKRQLFLLLVGLLVVLLIVLYITFFRPLSTEIASKEREMIHIQNDIRTLEQLVDKEESETGNLATMLDEKRIPRSRELDQLILILEEIEAVSSSRIEHINFTYDGSLPESDNEVGESEENNNDDEIEQSDTSDPNTDTENPVETAIDLSEKPEDLKVITLQLDVASPNYEHFTRFLKEVETQERITIVSTLEFEKPAEKELIQDDPDETITFTIELMTFYYEG